MIEALIFQNNVRNDIYLYFMPNPSTKSFLFLIVCLPFFTCNGQESRSTSNYAGTGVLSLNPAEIADNRMKAHINLGSMYVDYQNNFARWVAPHSFAKAALNSSRYPGDYKILEQKSNKNTGIYAQVQGPSVLYSLPNLRLAIAAGVNVKVYGDALQATNATGTFIYKGLYYRPMRSIVHENESFKFNLGAYNEFFFSVARVLREEGNTALKVGLTVKKLSSNLAFNINADDLSYKVEATTIVPDLTKSDVFFTQSVGSFVNASDGFTASTGWFLDQFTAINGIGNGFGADLGFVYEYRPDAYRHKKRLKKQMIADPKVNKYQWKFGAGIQDLGYLRFNDPSIQVAQVNASTPNQFLHGDLEGVDTPNALINAIENEYNLDPSNYSNSFNVLMPAAFIAHADVKLRKNVFVAAVYRQSLFSKTRIGPHRSSYLLVAPRYETKWFEIMMPFAIGNYFSNVNFGITGRVGPLFFGLTDLTLNSPLLNSRGIAGEVGLSIPIYYGMPKSPLKCYTELKSKKNLIKRRKSKFLD